MEYTRGMEPVHGARQSDPVVEAYRAGIDETLFDRNLRLTPTERIEQLQQFVAFIVEMNEAGRRREPPAGRRDEPGN